jgi:hypothetical protein
MPFLPALSLLIACNPQDADVNGSYVAFLQEGSSENLIRLERNGDDLADISEDLGLVAVDCRDLSNLGDEAAAAERLPGIDYAAGCLDGEDPKRLDYFTWLDDYAYWRKEQAFAPDGEVKAWRTEAVMTPEGDLQLTVHLDVPGIGDFRFGWSIDPDFQPQECRDTEDGAAMTDVDGNWLEGWQKSLTARGETGKLWPLNANAYQINPSNNGQAWYLPQEWLAGAAFARMEDEEFFSHATDYNDPDGVPLYIDMYANTDAYYPSPRATGEEAYANWITSLTEYHDAQTDMAKIGGSGFTPKFYIEDNSWRPEGLTGASGLDGWAGIMPGWVRIDNPDDIAVNNETPVTGEFQIYLEGLAAASKLMVRAEFTIHHIREDVWGYQPTLESRTRETSGTPTCGSTEPVAVAE